MQKVFMLTHQQKLSLNKVVAVVKVESILKAIGDDKSPGVDGYNAVFFKKASRLIQLDIIEAVLEYFNTSKIYKPMNYTSISLVPKNANPT